MLLIEFCPLAEPTLPPMPHSLTICYVMKTTTTYSVHHASPVSLISPHALIILCNQLDARLFIMSIAQAIKLASMQADETLLNSDLSTIPPKYHEFADMFSKKEADMLLPCRPYVRNRSVVTAME